MSKRKELATYLDRITDLCFSISELSCSEEEVAKPSTRLLNSEALPFAPANKGKEKVSEDQGSKSAVSEDWESVPDLPSETAPSYNQVVGSSSQAVYVTLVRKTVREQSVDSAQSEVTMSGVGGAAAGARGPPAAPAPPVARNYATCTAAQFEACWAALPTDGARVNAETAALLAGNQAVAVAVLIHRDERNTARVARLNNQFNQANNQIAAANANVAARASAPSKFENKESGPDIRQWIPIIEDYLVDTPNDQYLRIASSYFNGKPRSYWMSQWEAWQAENPGAIPENVANNGGFVGTARDFFRETMVRGYGLRTSIQSYWDTWNKLSQGTKSVDEYNVEFQQAMVNLREEITDEAVKIERYRSGLQTDLKEMCRTSPTGQRWATLNDLTQYATLVWPTVEARLAKRKSSQPTKSVTGKRKGSGGGSGRSSGAKLSAVMTNEQYAHNMENRLCHKCGKSGHIAKDCTGQDKSSNQSKGKKPQKKDF